MVNQKRFDKLDQERQSALFQAAAEEFAANGFDAASLNRILEKSGMGKSSLYYYFDDKADLFTTLIERSMTVLFKQMGDFDVERLTPSTFWEEIEAKYAKAITLVNDNDWLVRFGRLFYDLRGNSERGGHTGRIFDAARSWMAKLLIKGQSLGLIRTDLPHAMLVEMAMGLFETLDRWVVGHWADMSEDERQALPKSHIGLFQDLLGTR